jgi:site-specific recombinase XerD
MQQRRHFAPDYCCAASLSRTLDEGAKIVPGLKSIAHMPIPRLRPRAVVPDRVDAACVLTRERRIPVFQAEAQSAGGATHSGTNASRHRHESVAPEKHRQFASRVRAVSRKYVACVVLFIGYLRQRGIVNQIEDPVRPKPPAALGEFCNWLLHHRGLSPRTIDRHNRLICKLLPALGTDTTRWDAAIVRDVITAEVRRNKIPNAKCVISALRMYLRFLASVSLCRPGLDLAVPTVAHCRLSALPKYLVEDDIERIVNSCDLETDTGVRDHAILRPMTRAGFEYILAKHAKAAAVLQPSLAAKRISPHVLRHSCAMHTLQATHDVRRVALWLGHARVQSMEIYLRADPTEKLEAFAAAGIPNLRRGRFRPPDALIEMLRSTKH